MLVGYARVSTRDQETRMQLDALRVVGVKRIYQDKASGVSQAGRPELARCLSRLSAGDVVVVYRIDRIARSVRDLMDIVDRIRAAGADIRSLCEPLDTSSPLGVAMLQMLGVFAQLERSTIRERVIAGQVAAIRRGGKHGRPRLLSEDQIAEARRRYACREAIVSIARHFGVSKGCIERAVKPDNPRFAPRRPVLGPLLDAR